VARTAIAPLLRNGRQRLKFKRHRLRLTCTFHLDRHNGRAIPNYHGNLRRPISPRSRNTILDRNNITASARKLTDPRQILHVPVRVMPAHNKLRLAPRPSQLHHRRKHLNPHRLTYNDRLRASLITVRFDWTTVPGSDC
jgi:hypothetical protein